MDTVSQNLLPENIEAEDGYGRWLGIMIYEYDLHGKQLEE